MNILHISPNFNYTCGVSKYLTLVLKELQEYPDINLHFITNGGDSLERLETIGLKPVIMNFTTGWKNLFNFKKNLDELEKFCIENKIQIIHTHHRYPEFLVNHLKRKLNIKTVTTVHSLVKNLSLISFKSDKIIAVSKTVERNLIENFNINKEKIIQIYNPIDFNEVKKIYNLDFEFLKKYRVILFVGRNDKTKGLSLLIDAFKIISNSINDLALVIISDLNPNTKKKLSANSSRIFVFEPRSNIEQFYELSYIVALPSKIESLPYVMLEAGKFRKLFIGSATGGIDEFIQHKVNGLKFKVNDLDDLINKLIYGLSFDTITYDKITSKLFNKVHRLCNLKEYSLKICKIYEELIYK
ncbi:MAG: glycosyltransferase family 4 protein [Ignavibacterium sp.]|nr:glycosyltransferase family 4 protein [Ignavibacterium sp.]